jgi:hypothetical protein
LDHESVTAEHLTALVNPTGSQPASETDQPAGDARHPGEA